MDKTHARALLLEDQRLQSIQMYYVFALSFLKQKATADAAIACHRENPNVDESKRLAKLLGKLSAQQKFDLLFRAPIEGIRADLLYWWTSYREEERSRKQRERHELRIATLRASGLAKLTRMERIALGLETPAKPMNVATED